MATVPRNLEIRHLGRVSYEDALGLQRDLAGQRASGAVEDTLLLLEHDPVVTVGRGADPDDTSGVSCPVVEIERGGEATWHGPGQLIGYPILLLGDGERDLHLYLRRIEEVLILALGDLEFQARRNPPHTGVWIGEQKVASIGVAVKRWVTLHGFALNVNCSLTEFNSFRPCGLDPSVMTSLSVAGGSEVVVDHVVPLVIKRFLEVFQRQQMS